VSTVSGGIFRYSPPVAAATAVPQPVSTSAPIAARVAPPVIPLHALSLTLRRVEAGRSCDDTLMHNVGDQHWCTDCRTHTIVRLGASFGSPVHARPGSPKRGLEDLEKKPVPTGTHQTTWW